MAEFAATARKASGDAEGKPDASRQLAKRKSQYLQLVGGQADALR